MNIRTWDKKTWESPNAPLMRLAFKSQIHQILIPKWQILNLSNRFLIVNNPPDTAAFLSIFWLANYMIYSFEQPKTALVFFLPQSCSEQPLFLHWFWLALKNDEVLFLTNRLVVLKGLMLLTTAPGQTLVIIGYLYIACVWDPTKQLSINLLKIRHGEKRGFYDWGFGFFPVSSRHPLRLI